MHAPNMNLLIEYVKKNGWKQINIEFFYEVMMKVVAVTENTEDLQAIFV